MPGISDLGARALRWLPPETAHGVAVGLLRWGLAPAARSMPPPSLHVKLWGLEFPSPLGLAAGFDKNAAATELIRLVNDGGHRQQLGREAREYALSEFTWSAVADKYLDVYRATETQRH